MSTGAKGHSFVCSSNGAIVSGTVCAWQPPPAAVAESQLSGKGLGIMHPKQSELLKNVASCYQNKFRKKKQNQI